MGFIFSTPTTYRKGVRVNGYALTFYKFFSAIRRIPKPDVETDLSS